VLFRSVQIGIRDGAVDYDGACGNMTSAIGPFVVDEGMVVAPKDGDVTIRIHATNMGKIIHARFPVRNGLAAVSGGREVIGVAGSGAGVRLDFIDPGNTRGHGLLPGGEEATQLSLPDGKTIAATLVDSGNPCVFIRAEDLGLTGCEAPDALDADLAIMQKLEDLRQAASVKMGVATDIEHAGVIQSIPKIAIIAKPNDYQTLSGENISAASYDITARMISMGQAHKAMPVTGALCVATAARLATTLVSDIVPVTGNSNEIRIGTPSGVLEVDAVVDVEQSDNPHVKQASIWRTTRKLMEGLVLAPKEKLER